MPVLQLTNENFDRTVKAGEKPILIDFYADWCAPCRKLGPILEDVAEEYPDAYVFCRVNVDESPSLAADYQVSVIPTLVRIENGAVAGTSVGFLSREELLRFLNI